jgi:two-component system sensor histidine kinase RegB
MQRRTPAASVAAAHSPLQALAARAANANNPASVATAAPELAAQRIHLAWLVQLRWGALLGQLIAILLVDLGMHFRLPLAALFVVLGVEAVSNLAFTYWSRRTLRATPALLTLPMALDVVVLTALLWLTGGPFNPFSFLYLVNIALAAVVLPARSTWSLVALSLACFGLLFVGDDWFPMALPTQLNHADQMRMHMQGMWFAFGVAAVFITYFVTRVRHSLAERENELARARSLALQSEKLASLATLATGAAHELSTPLSTIAVVAKELERSLRGSAEVSMRDAQLIRGEVERCREILQRMAADAGQTTAPDLRAMTVKELLASAVDGLPRLHDVRLDVSSDAAESLLCGQAQATAQALRGVLKNAVQASPEAAHVEVQAKLDDGACRISVRDFGAGMSRDVLARAGEPFFTTKEPGEGMGLGLFLTRVVVERAGGRMELSSVPGQGTTAVLTLPVERRATNRRSAT